MSEHLKNKEKLGVLLTLTGGTLWGFSGSCGQFLFQYRGATSNWLVPIRLFSAGLLMLILLFLKDGKQIFAIWKEKEDVRDILIFGLGGMMLCQYTYFTTIQYSNAGIATVLQYLGPALIMVYLCLRNRVLPKKSEVLALLLCIAGTFILATHRNIRTFVLSGKALFWGLFSAVSLGLYTVQPVRLLRKFPTTLVIAWGMLLGGTLLMGLFRPFGQEGVVFDATAFLILGIIVVVGTMIAFTCYLSGVKYIGPAKASLIACVEPVSATIISVLWLKVDFMWMDLLGFVCIISTIFILSLGKSE